MGASLVDDVVTAVDVKRFGEKASYIVRQEGSCGTRVVDADEAMGAFALSSNASNPIRQTAKGRLDIGQEKNLMLVYENRDA